MRTQIRVAIAGLLVAGSVIPVIAAEEAPRTLPTLLIKGEVVSLDSSDAAASLLKVKDRYGFETPIYLTPQTTISKGDATGTASDLAAGAPVEVEYNFDINTAKRHAVRVTIGSPTAATTAAVPAAAPAAPAAASDAPAAPAAEAPAAAPAAAAPAADAAPSAPATQ